MVLNVEAALRKVEGNISKDHLHLASKPAIQNLLSGYDGEDGEVLFSEHVIKVNHRGNHQKRTLMVTKKALYNMLPFKLSAVRRRIQIESLSAITLSNSTDDFIFHVREDYDYWYSSMRRSEIVRTVGHLYKDATGMDIKVDTETKEALPNRAITKAHLKKRGGNKFNSAVTSKVRELVSKKKIRYKADGFNLDLTYITDHIIAMGVPANGADSVYRNPLAEVYSFLESRHKSSYKVYNLCSERTYDHRLFHNRVSEYGFDDHNVPQLKLVLDFCRDVKSYFEKEPNGLAAVHCKAGKGRTGVMISSYFLYDQQFDQAEDALGLFAEKRTHNSKGVTIPSQLRYVAYFQHLLEEYIRPGKPYDWRGEPLVMSLIVVNTVPRFSSDGCAPYFIVEDILHRQLFDSRALHKPRHIKQYEKNVIEFPVSVRVCGDIKVIFFSEDKHMFHFWFNTSFVENCELKFSKFQLDKACKDTSHKKFDRNFSVDLFFRYDDIKRSPPKPEVDLSTGVQRPLVEPSLTSRGRTDVPPTAMEAYDPSQARAAPAAPGDPSRDFRHSTATTCAQLSDTETDDEDDEFLSSASEIDEDDEVLDVLDANAMVGVPGVSHLAPVDFDDEDRNEMSISLVPPPLGSPSSPISPEAQAEADEKRRLNLHLKRHGLDDGIEWQPADGVTSLGATTNAETRQKSLHRRSTVLGMSSSVLARRYAEAKAEVASLRNNVDVLRDHLQRVLQEYNSLFTAITGRSLPRPLQSLEDCLVLNNIRIDGVSWDLPYNSPPADSNSHSHSAPHQHTHPHQTQDTQNASDPSHLASPSQSLHSRSNYYRYTPNTSVDGSNSDSKSNGSTEPVHVPITVGAGVGAGAGGRDFNQPRGSIIPLPPNGVPPPCPVPVPVEVHSSHPSSSSSHPADGNVPLGDIMAPFWDQISRKSAFSFANSSNAATVHVPVNVHVTNNITNVNTAAARSGAYPAHAHAAAQSSHHVPFNAGAAAAPAPVTSPPWNKQSPNRHKTQPSNGNGLVACSDSIPPPPAPEQHSSSSGVSNGNGLANSSSSSGSSIRRLIDKVKRTGSDRDGGASSASPGGTRSSFANPITRGHSPSAFDALSVTEPHPHAAAANGGADHERETMQQAAAALAAEAVGRSEALKTPTLTFDPSLLGGAGPGEESPRTRTRTMSMLIQKRIDSLKTQALSRAASANGPVPVEAVYVAPEDGGPLPTEAAHGSPTRKTPPKNVAAAAATGAGGKKGHRRKRSTGEEMFDAARRRFEQAARVSPGGSACGTGPFHRKRRSTSVQYNSTSMSSFRASHGNDSPYPMVASASASPRSNRKSPPNPNAAPDHSRNESIVPPPPSRVPGSPFTSSPRVSPAANTSAAPAPSATILSEDSSGSEDERAPNIDIRENKGSTANANGGSANAPSTPMSATKVRTKGYRSLSPQFRGAVFQATGGGSATPPLTLAAINLTPRAITRASTVSLSSSSSSSSLSSSSPRGGGLKLRVSPSSARTSAAARKVRLRTSSAQSASADMSAGVKYHRKGGGGGGGKGGGLPPALQGSRSAGNVRAAAARGNIHENPEGS